MMISTKICYVSIAVTLLCGNGLVAAGSLPPHQAAARQQGRPVVFFAAFRGSLRDVEVNPIIFDEVLVNQGSAYDNNTGVFTVPVRGIYQFVFAAQLCRGDHNNKWYIMINGDKRILCHAQLSGRLTTLNTCYLLNELNQGDQVSVKQLAGSCAWASTTSRTISFSGTLLASEGVSKVGGAINFGSSCPLAILGRNNLMASSCPDQSAALSGVAITLLFWILCP